MGLKEKIFKRGYDIDCIDVSDLLSWAKQKQKEAQDWLDGKTIKNIKNKNKVTLDTKEAMLLFEASKKQGYRDAFAEVLKELRENDG